jgi:2-polyprenyl-3-methyl-5-hydroxy-6-metoxy-1,4-benzoquinol methylase
MQPKEHWERIYSTKPTHKVSWFQEHAKRSLRLIQETGVPLSASIIDIGGGASTLVDDLLQSGYSALTVLDISGTALAIAQKRLGLASKSIQWIEANITDVLLPIHAYDVWHDRAVFHFLISPQERHTYIKVLMRAVKPGGHVIVATFAEDGPTQCSGLPVMRYSANELDAEFGAPFILLRHEKEEHHTPCGTVQSFVYCYWHKGTL